MKSSAQDNLYWNLLLVSMRAKHSLLELADRHDLTVMQLYTLCSMELGKAVPMNFISNLLSCDASNVTGIVDRLLSSGLILREENKADRRYKVITLTEAGDALKQKLLDAIASHDSEALGNLNAEQREQLRALLSVALTQRNS